MRLPNTAPSALALSMAALMTTHAAHAGQTAWIVDNLRLASASDVIRTFDTDNPSVTTQIGPTGVNTLMGGLDFDAAGTLFAYGQTTIPGLFRINTTTGAATLVGSGGLTTGYSITDLAYDPLRDRLLGLGAPNAIGASLHQLYSIDRGTGAASLLGSIQGTANQLQVGLAVDAAGRVLSLDLVTNALYDITSLSAVALPAALDYDANLSQGMGIDWSDTQEFGIGAFDDRASLNSRGQYRRVSANGTSTLVGQIGPNDKLYQAGDLAFRPIPAPGAAGLMALGGLALLRRRR